jgi:lipoprotein-anchoring transpeptidase ErfK/SrfK
MANEALFIRHNVFMVGGVATAGGGKRRFKVHLIVAAVLVMVAGCTSSSGGTGDQVKSVSAAEAADPTPAPIPDPTVLLAGSSKTASFSKRVRIVVESGSFESVRVRAKAGNQELAGAVSADGLTWLSEDRPKPASAYRLVAKVKDSSGKVSTKKLAFKVTAVPESQRVAFNVTPGDGATVGIGQPVVVRFVTPVTRRAAVQKVMTVEAQTPGGKAVAGSWSWLNSNEAHWKPVKFWTPGTKVSVDLKLAGVKAATDRYGRQDYTQKFTIGASHITRVDASSHLIRIYRDDKLVATWPTGTGKRGLETYSGTYVVLSKSPVEQMDSCTAKITCDKKDPDYYDGKEYWATRITASGTFLHAADWDPLMGRANTSHGCIHLSKVNAKKFYDHAVPGDIVIVSNTGRGPQERIDTQDPGLYDWNVARSIWKSRSAL